MLGILKEPVKDPLTKSLLDKFMAVMMDLNAGLDPSEVPAPLSRSIAALGKLLALPAEGSMSGTRTFNDQLEAGQETDESVFKSKSPHSMTSSQSGGSPYPLRDTILWGGSGHGMAMD